MGRRPWTEEEVKYLKDNFFKNTEMLAFNLHRTVRAVEHKKAIICLVSDDDPSIIPIPPQFSMSKEEKISRINVLAKQMRVRLEG